MKTKLLLLCGAAFLVALTRASAATLYVDAVSTNAVPPFTNWANAAAVIQDAVDAAAPGDEIVVTNGVYQTGARAVYGMSNRVAVTKPVMVRSVNGPDYTSIVGHDPIGDNAIRCVYLTNGATLSGFTLTNGATQNSGDWLTNASGGGLWCEDLSAVVSNCVITGNSADQHAGGAFRGTLNNCILTGNSAKNAGGVLWSTLNNCMLTNNSANEYGGGAWYATLVKCTLIGNSASFGGGASGGTLNNCMITSNSASSGGGVLSAALGDCRLTGNSASYGGGAAFSILTNGIILENSAWEYGGGAYGGALINCRLINNAAQRGGGASAGKLNNCTLSGNSAFEGGGVWGGTLNNCTLTGNSAFACGGAFSDSDDVFITTLNNCIVYYNSSVVGENNYYGGVFNYCSTTPDFVSGVGNITNAPLFVDANGWSNLRLQSNSPCINAGNNGYVTAATDLDRFPRIAGGTVDIGAYEFQSPASTISYAWLQQFGLPTDGSADAVDTDHDGHNNRQEWMAGTDPTNALSALRLTAPVITPTNVILTWTSVTNRTYTLEQSTNLGGAPAFSVLSSNLVGLPGTTSWMDTNAPVSSPRFYQLRVSP